MKIGKYQASSFNAFFAAVCVALAIAAYFYYKNKLATELGWPSHEELHMRGR